MHNKASTIACAVSIAAVIIGMLSVLALAYRADLNDESKSQPETAVYSSYVIKLKAGTNLYQFKHSDETEVQKNRSDLQTSQNTQAEQKNEFVQTGNPQASESSPNSQ